jgi:hypothetical protein
MPLLDSVPPIRGLRGRPRRKPRRLYADRGYDFDKRRLLWKRGIKPMIARRGAPTAPDWERSAGWSSARSPGCTNSSDSASATSGAPIFTRVCSNWPADEIGKGYELTKMQVIPISDEESAILAPCHRRWLNCPTKRSKAH